MQDGIISRSIWAISKLKRVQSSRDGGANVVLYKKVGDLIGERQVQVIRSQVSVIWLMIVMTVEIVTALLSLPDTCSILIFYPFLFIYYITIKKNLLRVLCYDNLL